MSRAIILLIAATALLCAAQCASALTFDVSVGTAKCFKEEMSKNQLVTGTYQVPTSNVLMMRFWVRHQQNGHQFFFPFFSVCESRVATKKKKKKKQKKSDTELGWFFFCSPRL
jgi:hypothetical protein